MKQLLFILLSCTGILAQQGSFTAPCQADGSSVVCDSHDTTAPARNGRGIDPTFETDKTIPGISKSVPCNICGEGSSTLSYTAVLETDARIVMTCQEFDKDKAVGCKLTPGVTLDEAVNQFLSENRALARERDDVTARFWKYLEDERRTLARWNAPFKKARVRKKRAELCKGCATSNVPWVVTKGVLGVPGVATGTTILAPTADEQPAMSCRAGFHLEYVTSWVCRKEAVKP